MVIYVGTFSSIHTLSSPPSNMELHIEVVSTVEDTFQTYYSYGEEGFSEDNSSKAKYSNVNLPGTLVFELDDKIQNIRLDLGSTPADIKINQLTIKSFLNSYQIDIHKISNDKSHQIRQFIPNNQHINISTSGTDPYINLPVDKLVLKQVEEDNKIKETINIGLISTIPSLLLTFLLWKRRALLSMSMNFLMNRTLIINLAKNDFKTKYAGSFLGIIWAFIQPIITVGLYWFVFQIGFKSGPVSEVPFILWLIAGMVPWFFFSDAFMNGTNSMLEYSYLVKKVVFQVRILPLVKVTSAFMVHIFFIILALLIYGIYGYPPSIYSVQVVYYSFCTFILALCLSFSTSAIIVFFKDLGHIISLILQVGMWLTPIMWNYTMIPSSYRWLLKINPMYYIVEGYRDAFINHVWFWERYNQSLYFWTITTVFLLAGIIIFKKLKPHFADVL